MRSTISKHEQIRRQCGYTLTELAAAVGFSRGYVSQVEGGQKRPSARYRQAVSQVLGVREALLFEADVLEMSP